MKDIDFKEIVSIYTKDVAKRQAGIDIEVEFDKYLSQHGRMITGQCWPVELKRAITFHEGVFSIERMRGSDFENHAKYCWSVMLHEVTHFIPDTGHPSKKFVREFRRIRTEEKQARADFMKEMGL